jgi:hypothetical protein|uniref:Uncharacterized protein n=1 Tax=viral metagenome TaxID=1070528 RepID=A0A6C0LIP8_9ZZZZ
MTEVFDEDTYIDDILNKSIYDYLNDKYTNQNKLYDRQLEVLKNTKIKDIRLQCFTDKNGNVMTFDIYTNNNEDCKIDNNYYKYQNLEEFKWILKNGKSAHVITCRINEIIKSYYCRNIQSSYLYGITIDDLAVPIDIDIKSLEQYEQIKGLLVTAHSQEKIDKKLLSKINDLTIKIKTQDDIIEDLIINNQELILKIEEQEKQIKELLSKSKKEDLKIDKIESLEKLVIYNESKNHYKFIYFFYTFIICLAFKMI